MHDKYNVVWAHDLVGMTDQVNAFLEDGWKLQGGLCYSEKFNMFAQAVVLTAEYQEAMEDDRKRLEWAEKHASR